MKITEIAFQQQAITQLRKRVAKAMSEYQSDGTPQVVSYTAPTGAGKTIIMASLIERIMCGDEEYPAQPEAVFVWLSDSPALNKQSKDKIDLKADRPQMRNTVIISEESFNQEVLSDGCIYFLNTQKLAKNSNLTHHSDMRQWTIWETLTNTVRSKSDRLYVIIDEAHRGMREGRQMTQATTIMQKFLKGSEEDNLPKMPVVVGMTATSARFNNLVANIGTTTIRQVTTTAESVRSSGLLKDRIILEYPDAANMDMAVLQAAADDWKDKVLRWEQYCREQHYAYVDPVMVIQVQNGSGNVITQTDLSDCLHKIEERTGWRLKEGEVVHTFGQTTADIEANGLKISYTEPSQIQDNRKIKIVFFKENLSTGWDCPRAETMMSFRRAQDATYIAQLLGRMVRTPKGMRILVDETLNDVRLFLPYFDADTVKDVIKALQDDEANSVFNGNVYGQSTGERKVETLSVKPQKSTASQEEPAVTKEQEKTDSDGEDTQPTEGDNQQPHHGDSTPTISNGTQGETPSTPEPFAPEAQPQTVTEPTPKVHNPQPASIEPPKDEPIQVDDIDRVAIIKAVNHMGLLTYDVRSTRTHNYLRSLFDLSRFLTDVKIDAKAAGRVRNDIVERIRGFVDGLKAADKYEEQKKQLMLFRLNTQTIDVHGNAITEIGQGVLFSTTDTDIDRQFRMAEAKLCNEGIGNRYGQAYGDLFNPNDYKIDFILFVSDGEQMSNLNSWAEKEFHTMADNSRLKAIKLEDRKKKHYNDIVSNGDEVSEHSFQLPESISTIRDSDGQCYTNHLYINGQGEAWIKLNSWEDGVIKEESEREDFVCWVRNLPRKPWALTIPYEVGGQVKAMYPDFIIVRNDGQGGYIVDVLEPHDPSRVDNLPKAKGFANYAAKNQCIGRVQMIREVSDSSGKRYKRLDLTASAVRPKVLNATTNEELTHIFNEDGLVMNE